MVDVLGQPTSTADPLGLPPQQSIQEISDLAKKRKECQLQGGTWNEETQTCELPTSTRGEPEAGEELLGTGVDTVRRRVDPNDPNSPFEIVTLDSTQKQPEPGEAPFKFGRATQQDRADIERIKGERLTDAQRLKVLEAGIEAEQLAGQVGQFERQDVEVTPTDWNEARSQALVSAIPAAISAAGAGAVLGGRTGATRGAAAGAPGAVLGGAAGTIIGGIAGFSASFVRDMTSNIKSQRIDNTQAQKRTLDEGKQNLASAATFAAANPENKYEALAAFNSQLSNIDQAYRQMKIDTSRDVAKFETAKPDLAEFEAFYSVGGERDQLIQEMRVAMSTQSDLQYAFMQDAYNRGLLDGN